jgi:uncharacterized membrane protein YqaE (UPF0057 family)
MNLFKSLLVITAITTTTISANAAFIVKKNAVVTSKNATSVSNNILTESNNSFTATDEQSKLSEAKQSNATQSIEMNQTAEADSSIPKILYIILALLGLGWLAMGINSNFRGSDWIIGLVLSLLFWIPGFIYTLVKMKKYYN